MLETSSIAQLRAVLVLFALSSITAGCKPHQPSSAPVVPAPASAEPSAGEPVVLDHQPKQAWLPPEPEIEPPTAEQLGEYVQITGGAFAGHDVQALAMKRTEVTVAEYRVCVDQGQCTAPRVDESCNWGTVGRDQHPVNCVSWAQASAYCEWAGGRLPTQWEWQWAARGHEAGRLYPWGASKPTCTRAVMSAEGPGCGAGQTSPVGSRPKGVSVDGLDDMAGNVWEWTATADPPNSVFRVLEGGSWFVSNPRFFRTDYGFSSPMNSQSQGDGLRCVR